MTDFGIGPLSGAFLWTGNILAAGLLLYAAYSAPWKRLRDNEVMHVYLAACVVVMVLWQLRAGVQPGLNFHLIGVTALTLMFGWEFSLIAVAVVVVAISGMMVSGWQAIGVNVLILGAVPVFVTQLILRFVERRFTHHFFVYIFINAFFTSGLALLAVMGTKSILLIASGVYDFDTLRNDYLLYSSLLFFPEALLNGMFITIFVVFRPGWVASFDDAQYLHRERKF